MLFEIFILYVIISIILNYFPQILHSKVKTKVTKLLLNSKKIKIIGHRCGLEEVLENSLAGIQHCKNLQIFGIEIDVQVTKDKKYIILHDKQLISTTGQPVLINQINYKDINPIMDNLYIPYKKKKTVIKNEKKLKPVLIDEYFKAISESGIQFVNIDVKTGKEEDFYFVLRKLKEYGIGDRTAIGSFKKFNFKKARRDFDFEINFFMCVKDFFKMYFYYVIGIFPFMKMDTHLVNSAHFFDSYFFYNFEEMKKKKTFKYFKVFFCVLKYVSRSLGSHLERRGIPIIYFLANNEKDIALAKFLGAHAIMCDNPSEVKKIII